MSAHTSVWPSLLPSVARLGKPHAMQRLENRRGSPRVILRRNLDDSRSCALVVERRLFWSFFMCVFLASRISILVCLSRLVRRAARRSRIFSTRPTRGSSSLALHAPFIVICTLQCSLSLIALSRSSCLQPHSSLLLGMLLFCVAEAAQQLRLSAPRLRATQV